MFLFLNHFLIFYIFLFYVILLLLVFTKIMLLLSFYLINFFFMKITFIFSCSGMFRHVPECSGMFHVLGFIDARPDTGQHTKLHCELSPVSISTRQHISGRPSFPFAQIKKGQ